MLFRLNHTRNLQLGAIAVIWLGAVAGIFAFTGGPGPVEPQGEPVVVNHWVSSHLMKEGLLPEMAAQFNLAGHRTKSGRPVVVEVRDAPPSLQAAYLVDRMKWGIRRPIPVVVTVPNPYSAHPPHS